MKIETLQVLVADEDKVIAAKDGGEVLGKKVYLGVNDSVLNYVEIDKPAENSESEDVDGESAV